MVLVLSFAVDTWAAIVQETARWWEGQPVWLFCWNCRGLRPSGWDMSSCLWVWAPGVSFKDPWSAWKSFYWWQWDSGKAFISKDSWNTAEIKTTIGCFWLEPCFTQSCREQSGVPPLPWALLSLPSSKSQPVFHGAWLLVSQLNLIIDTQLRNSPLLKDLLLLC